MNDVLQQIYATGFVQDSKGNSIRPFPSGILRESGRILYDLVNCSDVGKTLEVGMGYGLSTLFICQAHKDKGGGAHTAIDPNQHTRYQSIGLLNVKRAGLEGFLRVFPARSCQVLPRLMEGGERIDFAFIDGKHLFDYALVDFFYIDQMLKVGGLVVFDDLWLPGIRKVITFVLRNEAYRIEHVSSRAPVPLWRRVARFGQRWLQNPFEIDYDLKLLPQNLGVLRKIAQDTRPTHFHRAF